MSLKLWTTPLSYNCLRAQLVFAEKGITDFEVVPADIVTGSHKSAEFLAKSPFGQVPLLEDGDTAVFESRAVARYLAIKYANKKPLLMPHLMDLKTSGIFGMWYTVEVEEFNLHAVPLINQKIILPAMGQTPDQAVIDRHQARLMANLDVLDGILGRQAYMGGDEYTLVDISYMPGVYMLSKCGGIDLFSHRANFRRWWDDVSARPAWKKAVQPTDDAYAQVVQGWKERN